MDAFIRLVGSGLVVLALSSLQFSHGAAFSPSKPVRFIVPAQVGASMDVAAREIARVTTGWNGIVAPARTSKAIIAKLALLRYVPDAQYLK